MNSKALLSYLVVIVLALSGCSSSPDAMPPTQVDIFVLDLSTSNDKASQLLRLQEDLNKSLSSSALGNPKSLANEEVSGPITTIFTFIEETATRSETFKIQDAESVIRLWNNEFAKDRNRNAKSWAQISNAYNSYLESSLEQVKMDVPFSDPDCRVEMNAALVEKFNSDSKRTRIINVLCEKMKDLTNGYSSLIEYVLEREAPKTDIFGMLAKIDRMVEQIKKTSPESVVTVNIGSDMQHETGDSRDTPTKLRNIDFERNSACQLGEADRLREGIAFDRDSKVRVSGIGNAKISAEASNALVRYWECFFPKAEIR